MRPDDETQEFTQLPDDEPPAGDEQDESLPPPPATYAGRMRAESPAGEPEPEPVDAPEPVEEPEPEPAPVEEPVPDGLEALNEFTQEQPVLEIGPADPEPEPEQEPEPEDEPEPDSVEEPEPEPEPAAELDEPEPEIDAEEEPDAEAEEAADAPDPKLEAEEAALAGLRARTAEKAVRPSKPQTEVSVPPPAAVVAAEADDDDDGKVPRARPVWARFLAASALIVLSVAAATSISLLVYLQDVAAGLRDDGYFRGIQDQLTDVEGGDPQTILILGSDKRPTDETGRSDTTILLRVDPDRDVVSMLSVPRDLKVNIPGYGVDKLNAAYSVGGPKLTFEVVKDLVDIPIHHLVNINFVGFADAVNAIGCVYIDVDRRYFIAPESGIAEIDIEAGYQRLCGLKALQYVRFRHEDTDLVRSARQQDFLREARQKLEPDQIIRDAGYRKELVDVFTDYTTSDIGSATQLLELLKTFIGAADATVNEVHFPAQLGGPEALYVTAGEEAVKNAVHEFLGTEGTPGPPPEGTNEGGGDSKPDRGGDRKPDKPEEEKPEEPEGPAMEDVTATGQAVAKQLAGVKRKDGDPMIEFPIYYPTRMLPGSTLQTADAASRAFPIDGPGDDAYNGYKIVFDFFGGGGFSEYYGVSGTDWLDAPILDNPSEIREIDGRNYLMFYDGDRLRLIGWKTKGAAYWVNNTLTQSLDEDVMISIATSMRELGD